MTCRQQCCSETRSPCDIYTLDNPFTKLHQWEWTSLYFYSVKGWGHSEQWRGELKSREMDPKEPNFTMVHSSLLPSERLQVWPKVVCELLFHFFLLFLLCVCVCVRMCACERWGGGGGGRERGRGEECVCVCVCVRDTEGHGQRQSDRFGKWAESWDQGPYKPVSQCTTVDGIVGCCVQEAALHTVTVHTCQVNRALPAAALMLQCPQTGLLVLVLAPFHPQHRQAGTWSGYPSYDSNHLTSNKLVIGLYHVLSANQTEEMCDTAK